jgi:2-polyprenyl-3-methyl-5-hydroxy-6-metoxy-1,4-benzoquinol methylase
MPVAIPNSAMDRESSAAIARAFLPSRWHYHYVRSKLRSDPLYGGVVAALAGSDAPLLDLGCGVGLLAHCLRARQIAVPYRGVDNDAAKIAQARAAAARAQLADAAFDCIDLAQSDTHALRHHRGSVAILDVLQFLPPETTVPLLDAAVACLTPGARLVIRTGLAGDSRRARITRAVDSFSRALRWMNTGPKRYPERDALDAQLRGHGLDTQFAPLWGRTPFNNWLVVASRH